MNVFYYLNNRITFYTKKMNAQEFNQLFGNEQKCVSYLFDLMHERKCSNCKSKDHRLLEKKKSMCCLNCGCQRTLKSQTFMKDSNLPFTKWFQIIYFVLEHKENYSNAKIQRMMNMPRYASVLHALQKIRHVMRKFNSREEYDFNRLFDTKQRDNNKNKHHHLPQKSWFKIKANENEYKLQILYFRKPGKPKNKNYRFRKIIYLPEQSDFPIHTGSNREIPRLKRTLTDIRFILKRVHKWVSDFYLQLYLEEYCFKINACENLWDSFFTTGIQFSFKK